MTTFESLIIGNPDADKQAQIEATKLSTDELQRDAAGDVYLITAKDFQLANSPTQSGVQREKLDIKDEPPFTPEEMAKINQVKTQLTQLREAVADSTGEARKQAQQALDAYRATADCQQVIEWYKKAKKDLAYEKNRKFEKHDERHFRDETIDATVGRDIDNSFKLRWEYEEIIQITQFVVKQEGLMSMDRSFQAVLDNPQYDGEEVLGNNALNREIYQGFTPEVKRAINAMHIKIEVEKYDNEIEVYFVYGLNDKGEKVRVLFLDNWSAGSTCIYVLDDKEFGNVLSSQDKGSPYNQRIREKEDVIEKVVYRNGTAKSPYKVKKLPASSAYAIQ